jgi:hypothetical protein
MGRNKIIGSKMKYTINYNKQGKILGFAKGNTDLNIEVSNAIWFEAQSYNKIIIDNTITNFVIDGKVDDRAISFDKVDWRTPEDIESEKLQELKSAKQEALNSITVTTTNGNTFDGNETARGNMTSAILSSVVIGKTEDTWKLADNTSAVITITELKEALALSIQEVGRIVMLTSKEEL